MAWSLTSLITCKLNASGFVGHKHIHAAVLGHMHCPFSHTLTPVTRFLNINNQSTVTHHMSLPNPNPLAR